jgi:hypothetical protein
MVKVSCDTLPMQQEELGQVLHPSRLDQLIERRSCQLGETLFHPSHEFLRLQE